MAFKLQEATTSTTSGHKDDRNTEILAGVPSKKSTNKAPDETKKPRVPKFQLFPLGNVLDSYNYPPKGTIVRGGRAAATQWQKLMDKTRLTDDKENKKKKSGSRYRSYTCARKCGGYMKISYGEGKKPTGIVSKSELCKCPYRARQDVLDINYMADSKEDLVGDLILYINSENSTFVVDAWTNYRADGARSNNSFCSFKTKDGKVFQSENIKPKTKGGKWKLEKLSNVTVGSPLAASDNQPTSKSGSADCIICHENIAAPQLLSFVECGHHVCTTCRDGMCNVRPSMYELFFHLGFSGAPSSEPGDVPITAPPKDLILPNRMIVLNECAVQCPICCQPRERLVDCHGIEQILPVPHGWFGNRAVYSASAFKEHRAVFERTVQKYQELYDKAVHVLTKLPGKEQIDESKSKEDIFAVLQPAVLYLHKKVWVEQKWLQCPTIPLADVEPETTWFEGCAISDDTIQLIEHWFQNCSY
jgi:hypothetical protein